MSSASPARARACPRQSRRCRLLFHVFRQFHRLHSECGQMTNATAINAVPVLVAVHVGTTQEWSLRLNVAQHGKTHQVLTHSKDLQIYISFLIPRVVPRGRSQLVESFVWLVPLARIDRLIALS